MKNYNFMTFWRSKVLIFHIFCVISKNLTRGPHNFFCPNSTKYYKSRKMARFEKFQLFSLKFHDFPFKTIHY